MMLRKIMKARGLEKTFQYRVIELIFAGSFIYFRSILCTFINYNMWLTHLSFITKLSISITYAVGFFWIYMILNIAIKQVPDGTRGKESLAWVLEFVHKYKKVFIVFSFLWAVVLPYVLTQHLGSQFINLKIGEFIVF